MYTIRDRISLNRTRMMAYLKQLGGTMHNLEDIICLIYQRTSFIREMLYHLLCLIKYIVANIPIIANKNSKPGVCVGVGDSVGLGEGV